MVQARRAMVVAAGRRGGGEGGETKVNVSVWGKRICVRETIKFVKGGEGGAGRAGEGGRGKGMKE